MAVLDSVLQLWKICREKIFPFRKSGFVLAKTGALENCSGNPGKNFSSGKRSLFHQRKANRPDNFASLFRLFSLFIISAWVAMILPLSARSQTAEYKLKAVFLFNFVQFVDWPSNSFANAESPVIIGVLGTDPFGKALDETVQGEVVKGRKIQVRRFKSIDEVKNCHVLFISRSEEAKLNSILARLKGRSILTVGDFDGFALNGGMIRFINENNRIRFRINPESTKAANLSISSKLLQLSEIVSEKHP